MDDCSGKRAGDGPFASKKRSSLVLRDTANNRDRNPQFCSRIGCSSNLNSPKGNQASCSEKVKSSRLSLHSSSSRKEIIGSSSRKCSAINKTRNSLPETSKRSCPQLDTDSSETGSGIQDKPDVLEPSPRRGKTRRGIQPQSDDKGSSGVVGCSNVAKTLRTRRNCGQKSGLHNQDALSTTKGVGGNASKCLRNVRCNSVSDVLPSSSLSSDSNLSRRKDVTKKKICRGETNSSAKGKRTTNPWFGRSNTSSGSGVPITDLRQTTNRLQERDNGATLIRTRRSLSGYTRTRVTGLGSGNNLLSNDSHGLTLQVSEPDTINLNAPSSTYLFSLETSLSSYGRPRSSNGSSPSARPSSPLQVGNSRALLNRESYRRFNMDGIAEVLLALEQIEQDEELTYEQLLVLETNLFLNGLNFDDQHRDMRLDIDNMSYEELLALEERMGTVSTALSEEALTECLKTCIYHPTPAEAATAEFSEEKKDDVKCSICQEEYKDGDEVGHMQCEHRYHTVCVQQWLRLKNWCPMCKAPAAPSSLLPPAT